MSDLIVTVDDRRLEANWGNENQSVRAAIEKALPLSGSAARWGDEVYMTVPFDVTPETTRETVEPGCLAYWPTGPAICLFWGPTPASTGAEPVAASPVAPVAQVTDITPLQSLSGGGSMTIERSD